MIENAKAGIKGFVSIPLEQRFWSKVIIQEGCWKWIGSVRGHVRPYGEIWNNGKKRPASQISWELKNNKPFPEGMDACHKCDNPNCVNPDHIFPGTASDNARDAENKGRLVHNVKRVSFCKRGHKFEGDNIGVQSNGSRHCKICKNLHNKARYNKEIKQALNEVTK